ncbi:4-(cytidine 5'-diphospho)-2-C-methyl-D-erythritol kinase [Emcibacter sp.]|uniref:4-(cytidine 5'-diphospho)-2-C-methyl-D-erythritol kinase n=1 Tax=Emcibacter sp. TaxID=1979954 RepID=UPI003A93BC3E
MALPPNDSPLLSERAPAKINLDLRVTGRQPDGYHLLDSLVVFADCGDVLDYYPEDNLYFEITGPFSAGLQANDSNLVCRTISAFTARAKKNVTGRFVLTKNLPVASGIGGGSADAAAALRLLNRLYPDLLTGEVLKEIAFSLGADVPACLMSRTLRMRSIGEELGPVGLGFPLYILLANPGVSVETAGIFKELASSGFQFSPERDLPNKIDRLPELLDILTHSKNDLQPPACRRVPKVAEVIDRLAESEGCRYTAMSGSGATCFGLFDTLEAARSAGENIAMDSKSYWLQAAVVL